MVARIPEDVIEVQRRAADLVLNEIGGGGWAGLPRPREPIALSVIRNELRRVPDFLEHHRRLGVRHFAIIDNRSSDGTRQFLMGEPDVRLFDGADVFEWRTKHAWIMRLVELFGRDRWYLLLDADEHCVFDGSERAPVSLLVDQLERDGRRRARASLLDMYREGPLAAWVRPEDVSLESYFPLFDAGPYREHRNAKLTSRVGGPRQRIMGRLDPSFRPELTKYPLFKLAPGEWAYNPHVIWPPTDVAEDPCLIGLLHYKFDGDIVERITDAVKLGQYWNASAEYKVYLQCLTEDPAVAFVGYPSRVYRCTSDLVECGLIARLPNLSSRLSEPESLAATVALAERLRRAQALRPNS